LKKELKEASVDKIEIERTAKNLTIIIHSGKPGLIIGRSGAGIEELKKKVKKNFFRGRRVEPVINVQEVTKPALSASIVARQIVMDIEKRMPYRRVMKQAIERVEKAGAKGVKILVAGRLNGADIARTEMLSTGSVPLQSLRADIDFFNDRAATIYGAIGVKVWIYRGEVFEKDKQDKKEN